LQWQSKLNQWVDSDFKMTIYPTITTLVDYNDKLKEIDTLKLKTVCVFLTGLNYKERKELLNKIQKTPIKEIPFVHLRSDMKLEEIEFLIKNFNTKVFNIHTEKEHPLEHDLSKYKNLIYIENVYCTLDEKEIQNWAGICLDFSHLENDRLLRPDVFEKNMEIIKKNKIGCNHISAIKKHYHLNEINVKRFDDHFGDSLEEFDYLKKYNKNLFSDYCAIELNNSIHFQLKVIDYIKNDN
jgi:hypothetical protein